MQYKGHEIVTATVYGRKGTQIYRATYIIAPDGSMTKTDSERKAREIVDKKRQR